MIKRIKSRYIIIVIFILLLVVGIVFYFDITGESWSDEFKQYLEPNSVWKYENSEKNFEMELVIPNTINPIADNYIKYVCDGRKGKWQLALKHDYKKIDIGYESEEVFYRVWEGKVEYEEEKFVISEITEYECFQNWIECGELPEKYAKDTVPEGIECIEMERVK